MNIERARFNMIEQQIRPWEVLDGRVLALLQQMPRELFVPDTERELAFADIDIPLAHGQSMMAPKVEARLLQALNIKPTDRVLEIGTGSGYLTALLAKMAKHVYSVDIHASFKEQAADKLARVAVKNVTLETGDAAQGWRKHAPYDVMVVTASCPQLPEIFGQQLAINGRLFAVVGQAPAMEALLITRTGDNAWARESLFETVLPPMENLPAPRKFVF